MSLKFSVKNILNLESTSESIPPLIKPHSPLIENAKLLLNFSLTTSSDQRQLLETLALLLTENKKNGISKITKNEIRFEDDCEESPSRSSSIASSFSSTASTPSSLFNHSNFSKALPFMLNFKNLLQTTSFTNSVPDSTTHLNSSSNKSLVFNIDDESQMLNNQENSHKNNASVLQPSSLSDEVIEVVLSNDVTNKKKYNHKKKLLLTELNTFVASKDGLYKCETCNKVFTAHYNLTRHMPVHTGARPFVCKVKLFTFNNQK